MHPRSKPFCVASWLASDHLQDVLQPLTPLAVLLGMAQGGLCELNDRPVGGLRADERFLPLRVVVALINDPMTSAAKAVHLRPKVIDHEGHVVHALAAACEKPRQEAVAVRAREDDLHPAASRVLELYEAKAVPVGNALYVAPAEELAVQLSRLPRVVYGHRKVVESNHCHFQRLGGWRRPGFAGTAASRGESPSEQGGDGISAAVGEEAEPASHTISPLEPFGLSVDAMRARRGVKWQRYDNRVLPAFVADMDFAVADPVQQAVRRLVDQQDYGYAHREGRDTVQAAFADRMLERFGWEPSIDRTVPIADLLQGVAAAIVAFSEPGDGVVVQTPIYPPFLVGIEGSGRRQVLNPLVDGGSRLVVDAAGLRSVVDEGTRILLLCNPHNPSGRVLDLEELEAVGRVAVERDLVVISDEIHSDLVYAGRRHIPTGSLGAEVAARTVTLNSATKGFNIAALRCGVMHFGSDELLARFRRAIPERLLGSVNAVGLDATVAAWRHGQPWLDQVMERLAANRARLARWVGETAPAIRFHPPEATYLAWLDCRDLGLPGASPHEFFLNEAQVALGVGGDFGPGGETCVRLNFATSAPILEEVLERMAAAIHRAAA